MNRCTISEHRLEKEKHLDIFFETEPHLETYEAEVDQFSLLLSQKKIFCRKKQAHRKIYLEYEGEVSANRGNIKILWKGFYENSLSFFLEEIDLFLLKENLLRIDARS
ncbi:MAG TPA: hypothetical protein PK079_09855 [Leptospiraceae bacterium]|nr:hypothetical protein [Leptospiraceae bacterium]HMW04723.1 hypothetical protein [Leptospiraceae bacterium]HMX31754.1 hypothetical protein [Leptospiraceae bacterium]HMY30560.1 hypothetical protein [Leptospiraceae bacterium]HMZ64139.1 hypothetical protein [Leptospiraceae bacterium]